MGIQEDCPHTTKEINPFLKHFHNNRANLPLRILIQLSTRSFSNYI
jgi:hypothetical protein